MWCLVENWWHSQSHQEINGGYEGNDMNSKPLSDTEDAKRANIYQNSNFFASLDITVLFSM